MKMPDLTPLVLKLKDKGLTLAFAESCTAGSLAAELSKATGTTGVFLGSMVTYDTSVKQKVLKVKKKTLDLYTAESHQVTNEMVLGLHSLLKADVCIAVTGLFGGGASETVEKPVGTVFVSILFQKKVEEYREVFKGDFEKMRHQTVAFIFQKLKDTVERHFLHD
ncbi:nicotinamide-nucleotide amidohydrolase family protein [Nibribacter ruber]|uniref:Nicotinamide-nucleotide amidohydrolase family protein n=1 Tax=Nibribacter ruber TaxID=2698458 RepID=A0A6P1P3F0_9BACT|nr:nicotinamide-nucleotide amidohydrolase family protein [Nibribacter ruber]QHL88939.1 nicotinamide-nucleotide amidohydrolase family protein [Nibribacter ruber]